MLSIKADEVNFLAGSKGSDRGCGSAGHDEGCIEIISFGYTDLNNPGHGDEISEYTEIENLEAGRYYDYTFYMLPTVYTVAPDHTLQLILTTWDPYRAFLDESFMDLDLEKDSELVNYDYSYTVDNTAIRVMMPVA